MGEACLSFLADCVNVFLQFCLSPPPAYIDLGKSAIFVARLVAYWTDIEAMGLGQERERKRAKKFSKFLFFVFFEARRVS